MILALYVFPAFADSVLVIHGLNARPEKMSDIVNVIKKSGHDVQVMRLRGHHSDKYNDFLSVSKEEWVDDLEFAYNKLKGKKHVVAYSLGGLVANYAMKTRTHIRFDSQVLFAPAISTKWYAGIIKIINFFRVKTFPSMAPTGEQIHKNISVKACMEILAMEKELKNLGASSVEFNNIPTKILIDERDGMVSASGLKKWLKYNELDKWKFVNLESTRDIKHMIIMKEFQTPASWARVEEALRI